MSPNRLLSLILLFSTCSAPVLGQETKVVPAAAEASARSFLLNARDVDIQVFADDVSAVTGRTLILDPAVTGKVTVLSQEPLDADGVWKLFLSVLRVQGYAAIESGDAWRVVPRNPAGQAGALGRQPGGADADIVTRLIRLESLGAAEAAQALRPLLSATGSVEPFNRPNSLIVTGYADDVSRIEILARQLDTGGGETFVSIPLTYAAAAETAASIERLLAEAGRGPRIAADLRSNQIIIRGNAREIDEARNLASQLDQPGGAIVTTRVFRLDHSDAETMIDVLQGLSGAPAAATNPVARSLTAGSDGAVATLATNPAFGTRSAGSSATTSSPFETGPQSASGSFSVQAAAEINAIIARGTASELSEIEALIAEMDVRRPQVLIEAAIVEVTGDAAEQLGIQLGLGDAAPDGSAGAISFSDQGLSLRRILTILGSPAAIGLTEDGLSAGISSGGELGILIQAFGSSANANLLSTPSLMTLDNQPAEIVVGQNVPFRTGSFSTTGNTAAPFTTIEREDVGITLRVHPRIYDGDVVRLEVSQEVSSLVNAVIPGASDLITNRRSIQTTVLADNGGTVVLGGLITDDRVTGVSKVPVLGDTPLIGGLFRNTTKSGTRRTLFVFLKPTILRNADDVEAETGKRLSALSDAREVLEEDLRLLVKPKPTVLTIGVDSVR
jgi:general secretion pathway protein D